MVKSCDEKLVEYVIELNQLESISVKQKTKILSLIEKLVENAKKEGFKEGYSTCKEEYNIP